MDNRNYYKMFLDNNSSTNNKKEHIETTNNNQIIENQTLNQIQNQNHLNASKNLDNNTINNQNNTLTNSSSINNNNSNKSSVNTVNNIDEYLDKKRVDFNVKNNYDFQPNEMSMVYTGHVDFDKDLVLNMKLRELIYSYRINVEINPKYKSSLTTLSLFGSLNFISLFFVWSGINMRNMTGTKLNFKFSHYFFLVFLPIELYRRHLAIKLYKYSFDERYKGYTIQQIKDDIASLKKEKVKFV